MATFMNSLNKKKAKMAAEDQFSRLAADIQSKKMARIGLENQGDVDVENIVQAGSTTRTGMEQTGATKRTGMEQTGQTLRRNIAEAGATGRTGMQLAEDAREFDLDYGLNVRKDVREQKGFDFDQAELEALSPFAREAKISQFEAERDAATISRRTTQRELNELDSEDEAIRKRKLAEVEARRAQRQQEIDVMNAFNEEQGMQDIIRQKRRQSADYLGTVFGGY